ncbi:hypothetical protein TUN199_12305, partial [Pyrenophora tritici-repentis]
IDRPLNEVFFAMQLSPTRFWSIAAQQASEAANAAGFVVDKAHHLGKGDCFGLPVLDSSLPASTLVVQRDCAIVEVLQEHASTFKRRVDEAVLPGNVIGQASQHEQ